MFKKITFINILSNSCLSAFTFAGSCAGSSVPITALNFDPFSDLCDPCELIFDLCSSKSPPIEGRPIGCVSLGESFRGVLCWLIGFGSSAVGSGCSAFGSTSLSSSAAGVLGISSAAGVLGISSAAGVLVTSSAFGVVGFVSSFSADFGFCSVVVGGSSSILSSVSGSGSTSCVAWSITFWEN